MTIFQYGETDPEQSEELADFLDANKAQRVTLILNSPGGSAFAGAADAAAIEAHGQVTAIGRGIVASAATLPLVVAKRRLLHPACLVMIHNPSALAGGTADDLRGAATQLDTIATTYRAFYARCTGQSAARIEEMMAAETWLTPEEALALGFADALEQPADPDLPVLACFDPKRFRNPPAQIVAAMAARKGSEMNDLSSKPAPAMEAKLTKIRGVLLKTGYSMDAAPRLAEIMADAIKPEQLRKIAAMAKQVKYTLDELTALITELVDPEEPSPDPTAKALELILAAEKAKDIEMSGGAHSGIRTAASVGFSWDDRAAFVMKMVEGLEAKISGTAPSQRGRDAASMSIGDIAMACTKRIGLRPVDAAEAVRMAGQHTASDFPLILENSLTNVVGKEAAQRLPDLVRASREMTRSDYREGRVLSLSATAMPEEVAEGAQIRHITADEKGEATPTPRDVAALLHISNKALVNDSTATGMLQDMGRKMAEGAVEKLRAVLLEPLLANGGAGMKMADGKTMFHTDHRNLAAAGAPISVTSLSAARLALRKAKDARGALKPIEPWALVVPAELETSAQQVLAEIAASTVLDVNPFSGKLELIVEPGLTSAAGWYLIGDPALQDGLAHAFLDGQTSPRVETRAGWNTLGMEFRLTWAVDAKFIGIASWFRNPG